MVEIEDLKDKVSYIEREKIVKIEEDITQIKLSQVETNTLVKEFSRAIDKQCDTMDNMVKSMQDMSLNMRDNNNSIHELKNELTSFKEQTTEEVSDLRCKVGTQEKATWVFVKNNIWKIISVISVAGIVVYLVLGKVGI